MTKGEMQYAVRKALNNFDKWNDVTGYFGPCTSYYYEMQKVIEDAVDIGARMAAGGVKLVDEFDPDPDMNNDA